MRILIVDDEKEIRDSLEEAFTEAGFEVFTSGGAAQCLKLLKFNRIDCIVTDLRMPEVHGQYLIEILKAGYPEIPIVVLSAFIESEEDLLSMGAKKIFSKPADIEALLDSVNELVA